MWELPKPIKFFGELFQALQGIQWLWIFIMGSSVSFAGLFIDGAKPIHYILLFLAGAMICLGFMIWRQNRRLLSSSTQGAIAPPAPITTVVLGNKTIEANFATLTSATGQTIIRPGYVGITT